MSLVLSFSVHSQDGSTPLHYAAAFGQTHVLETLVKAGIAVDNRDDARNTPLHLAAGALLVMLISAAPEVVLHACMT